MPEHPTDAHFLFTFVFKQALIYNKFVGAEYFDYFCGEKILE